MKFSCGFSIFILLFILPSSIFAVKCPTNVDINGVFSDLKTCDYCVYFACGTRINIKPFMGCAEDFYGKCSKFSSDIDFIKSKSPQRLDYAHATKKDSNVNALVYISGCGNEADGTQCIEEHIIRFTKDTKDKKVDKNEDGAIYWNDGENSYFGPENSGNQNGAFKFIGIIAIGWIMVAWIY